MPHSHESTPFPTPSYETPENIFEDRELLEAAYTKAADYLEEYRISLDKKTFPNYSNTLLEKSNAQVAELQEKFASENTPHEIEAKKVSVIMEAILTSMTENDWFGPDAQMITPSHYDDIVNGIDGCLEFSDQSSADYLALSVDFTYSSTDGLQKKIRDIEASVRAGTLSKMDFFVSSQLVPGEDGEDVPRFVGTKSGIPKVVVGCDSEHITDMAKLWVEGKNKSLATHPARLVLLDQMILQMNHYISIAEEADKQGVADAYRRDLAIIQSVRRNIAPEVILSETDRVTEGIRELTRH